jgi:hypothetical protein
MSAYVTHISVFAPAVRPTPRIVAAAEWLFDRARARLQVRSRAHAAEREERRLAHDRFERRRLAMEWMTIDPRAAAELIWATEHAEAERDR